MVSSAVVVGLIGLFTVVVGVLGLSGRLMHIPSSTLMGNYSAQLFLGGGLLLGSLVAALQGRSWLAPLLSLPTVVLFGVGMYAFTFRPPAWSQPEWQREMDEAVRRSRR